MLRDHTTIQATLCREGRDFVFGKCRCYRPDRIGVDDGRARQQPASRPSEAQPQPSAPKIADQHQSLGRISHLANQS